MSDKTRSPILLWAPEIAVFGGGIAAFSGEVAEALPAAEVLLFSKHDPSNHWNGKPLRGTGAFPARFRTPLFCYQLLRSGYSCRPRLILSTHLNFGPVAAFLKRRRGIPYALVAHGVDVAERLPRARADALRLADRVIAVSRWTRQRLMTLHEIDPERIEIVPNTVNATRFQPGEPTAALRDRYRIRDADHVILTVARLAATEAYKGYDMIIRALPELLRHRPNTKYLLVGRGDDLPRIRRLVSDCRVAEQVIFAGFVPNEELPDHYRLADTFAMPSTGEGFGIVFLEAMASGVPVLAGNQDGSTDALADGQLGVLVNPTDPAQVTQGLLQLMNRDGPPWWYEPHRLREQMLARFGQPQFANRLQAALRDLL